MITASQLLLIMPQAGTRAAIYAGPLSQAMLEFDINVPRRAAAFLATIAEESWELTHVKEITDGHLYEPPGKIADTLGNTQPGDGARFIGRGLGQATGRWMYGALAKALSLPLLDQPELLEEIDPACRSAAWIWQLKKLNAMADQEQFGACCYRWNGGYNGLDARIGYWLRARKCLGL